MTPSPLRLGDTFDLNVDPITRTTLALFAASSGDPNPIHLDIDAAQAAGFDDVFGHGMLTLAHVGRLLTDLVPQQSIRTLGGRFAAITPVHAEPQCSATVIAVETLGGATVATLELVVTLPDGTVTFRGSAVVELDPGPSQHRSKEETHGKTAG